MRRLIVHVDLPSGHIRTRTIALPTRPVGNLESYLWDRMSRTFGRISSLLSYHRLDKDDRCSYCRHPRYLR